MAPIANRFIANDPKNLVGRGIRQICKQETGLTSLIQKLLTQGGNTGGGVSPLASVTLDNTRG